MITFNGQSSDDFYMLLEGNVHFPSPSRESEFVKIRGQDGETNTGDGTLNNVEVPFPFRVRTPQDVDIKEVATDISNWLKKDNLWHDLIFEGDDEYIYRACYVDEYDLERVVSWYGKVVLTFKCKPYKYLASGLLESQLKSTLTNTTNRIAKPKLTIKGSGDVTVKVGESVLTIKGMDGGCVVDTLYSQATSLDGSRAIWDKITTWPLPTIAPGKQAVTVTGNVTDIRIIPRWEVIVG